MATTSFKVARLRMLRIVAAAARVQQQARSEWVMFRAVADQAVMDAVSDSAGVRIPVAAIQEMGAADCAVGWKPLRHVLTHLSDDEIGIAWTDRTLTIRAARSETNLAAMAAPEESPPPLHRDDLPMALTLSLPRMHRMVRMACRGASDDREPRLFARSPLSAIALAVHNANLWMVGADGYQLAAAATAALDAAPDQTTILLPADDLQAVIAALSDLGDDQTTASFGVINDWGVFCTPQMRAAVGAAAGFARGYPWGKVAQMLRSIPDWTALRPRWRAASSSATGKGGSAAEQHDGLDYLVHLAQRLSSAHAAPVIDLTAANRQLRLELTWRGAVDGLTCDASIEAALPEPLTESVAVRLNGTFLACARRAFGPIEPELRVSAPAGRSPIALTGIDSALGVHLAWLIMPIIPSRSA